MDTLILPLVFRSETPAGTRDAAGAHEQPDEVRLLGTTDWWLAVGSPEAEWEAGPPEDWPSE
jgi:hypothetical protein